MREAFSKIKRQNVYGEEQEDRNYETKKKPMYFIFLLTATTQACVLW